MGRVIIFRPAIVLIAALLVTYSVFDTNALAQRGSGGRGGGGGGGGRNARWPPPPPPAPEVNGIRLEVGWISREPSLPPPETLTAPREQGWPRPGSAVHWVAHVLNRSPSTARGVPYEWWIDGRRVHGGIADFAPGATEMLLPWTWTFARHAISFRIAPPNGTGDPTENSWELTVESNALSFALLAHKSLYGWMLESGRPGIERLFQFEIRRWNALLARAVSPSTPEGVVDRLRLDRLVVMPDGTTPRALDFMVADFCWFFPAENRDARFMSQTMDLNRLGEQTIVLHELLHERGLTDTYDYDVLHQWATGGSKVEIAEDGRRVAGTFLMPARFASNLGMVLYRRPIQGLMSSLYRRNASLDEVSANGLNLIAGRRTPMWRDQWGNLISLGNATNPDSYVFKIPQYTDVQLLDDRGAAIGHATVDVYTDHSPWAYHDSYLPSPDATFLADANAVVALPREALLQSTPTDGPPKSRVTIIGVRSPRGRGFAFVPVYDLNRLYFRGGRERAAMSLTVKLHPW